MFAFHFFVLVCFLIPYGLQTAYWVFVNETQTITKKAANEIARELEQRSQAVPGAFPAGEVALRDVVRKIGEFELDAPRTNKVQD
jgi:hypothetical protein